MTNLSEFMNSINFTKVDLIRSSDTPATVENAYTPFVVNKCLSYFLDTAIYANELNKSSCSDKQMHYDFLRINIPKRKRFAKWHQIKENEEKISLIMEYFNYSKSKAKEASKIITDEQFNIIKSKLFKGTVHD